VDSTGHMFAYMNLTGGAAPLMILVVKPVGLSNVILYLFGIKH